MTPLVRIPRSMRGNKLIRVVIVAALVSVVPAIFVGYRPPSISLIGDSSQADPENHTFSQTIWIENGTLFEETILGATSRWLGIATTDSSIAGSVTVPRNGRVHITLRYKVNNCQRVRWGLPPVTLHLSRWWGTKSVTLQDHGFDYPDALTACGRP